MSAHGQRQLPTRPNQQTEVMDDKRRNLQSLRQIPIQSARPDVGTV